MTRPIERVAIVGPAPPDRGGIARETALLARELEKSVAVTWLTFSRPYPRWLDPRRFDVSPHDARPPGADPVLDYRAPSTWRRAARKISDARVEAVVAPWWTSFWGLPLRTVFRKVRESSPATTRVLLCHNVREHEESALGKFLTLGAFLSSDAFVVHAESDRELLSRSVPGRPIAVFPHPIAAATSGDRDRARRELGIFGPLVLFLGLVRRYKGVGLLLDAAPRIVAATGATIAVVGEVFPEARPLERRRRSSPVRDSILWRDEYVTEEEMARWLAACDVVVLPYRYVSGSGIAARAIAAGRPMAAAAVGGLVETVRPGETGELFAPGNAEALAGAIERVLAGGIARYAPGLAAAAEGSSWPRYAEGLLAFLGSLEARAGR